MGGSWMEPVELVHAELHDFVSLLNVLHVRSIFSVNSCRYACIAALLPVFDSARNV